MSSCQLCSAATDLMEITVAPQSETVTVCTTCQSGIEGEISDAPHWRCLSDAIWSTEPAVQVTAYRLLNRLSSEVWARDILDIAYLEPETLAWAEAGMSEDDAVVHRDSNGVILSTGDSVVLIKDLPVKGAGFTAKRGTAVRNISLVSDNETHIEGRVEGQRIVILTQFVKKS